MRYLECSDSQRQKVGILVARGCGQEEWELLFNGYGVSVLQDEKSSGGWLHDNLNVLKTAELYS